jgi:catechol 2,3-dioxygenase-like lactoylglutathione lyase family enzyme
MSTAQVRGIEHFGITVPDIDAATEFLVEAIGAEVIYESYPKSRPPLEGEELEQALNLAQGMKIVSVRVLKVEHGPGIELFEMHASEQREPSHPSDFGLQHFVIYAADIDASATRFENVGGTILNRPAPLIFPPEIGDKNMYCYGRTLWGMIVEFVTYVCMPYEKDTTLRRWRP